MRALVGGQKEDTVVMTSSRSSGNRVNGFLNGDQKRSAVLYTISMPLVADLLKSC